ncbi:MAG: RnfABCDGE type electron transport complex subunit B [Proteobacteria bacterium]|nr:RnfABCDGE type electron transport complex subunit B [Pseudomonadota bacterium]
MIEAILSLSGLGLVAGFSLGIASRVFHVEIDPKVEAIENVLLGSNCGACGFPGCSGLANAIVAGEGDIHSCLPGGEDVVKALAEIMGVEATAMEKEIALVLCKGGDRDAKTKFDYRGVKDCWAAMQVGGGFKSCSFGCLGLGSCVKACEYDSIVITEDRLAIIVPEKCTGCTMCVVACPKDLIKMVPESQKVHVLCSNTDKGPATKKVCDVGCIGCTLCTKKTTNMTMQGGLAIVDYSILDNAHDPCEVCPTNTISDYNEAPALDRFVREKKKPAKKEAKPKPKVETKADAADKGPSDKNDKPAKEEEGKSEVPKVEGKKETAEAGKALSDKAVAAGEEKNEKSDTPGAETKEAALNVKKDSPDNNVVSGKETVEEKKRDVSQGL